MCATDLLYASFLLTFLSYVLAYPCCLHSSLPEEEQSQNSNSIRRQLLDPGRYVASDRPGVASNVNSVDEIQVQLYVTDILDIDQQELTFEVKGYLRLWWTDRRLRYDHIENHTGSLSFQPNIPDTWLPDIYIDNAVKVEYGNGNLLTGTPDGSIWWSRGVFIMASCAMDFAKMPWDSQTCHLKMGSYSKDGRQLTVKFREYPDGSSGEPILSDEIFIPEWNLTRTGGYTERQWYGTLPWDWVYLTFDLDRRQQYYITYVIAPGGIFCICAWANYWIDRKMPGPRVSLAGLVLLALNGQVAVVTSLLPKVAYTTWLSTYLMGLVMLNAIGIVVYGIISVFHRLEVKQMHKALRVKRWDDLFRDKTNAKSRTGASVDNAAASNKSHQQLQKLTSHWRSKTASKVSTVEREAHSGIILQDDGEGTTHLNERLSNSTPPPSLQLTTLSSRDRVRQRLTQLTSDLKKGGHIAMTLAQQRKSEAADAQSSTDGDHLPEDSEGQANAGPALMKNASSTPTPTNSSPDTHLPEHRLTLDKDAPFTTASLAMAAHAEQTKQITPETSMLTSLAASFWVSEGATYYRLPRWIKENFLDCDVSKIVTVFASCDSGFTGWAKHDDLMEAILKVSEPENDVSGKIGPLFAEMDFKFFQMKDEVDTDYSISLQDFLWIVLCRKKRLATAPLLNKASFQLKRARNELVFHFRKTKTSKLIDLHMRWLYPVIVVGFNVYMFSII